MLPRLVREVGLGASIDKHVGYLRLLERIEVVHSHQRQWFGYFYISPQERLCPPQETNKENTPGQRGLWADQLRHLQREADALGAEPSDSAERLAWRQAQCAINQQLQEMQRQFGRPVETAQQMGRPPACEQLAGKP